jgi:hypothetical protein
VIAFRAALTFPRANRRMQWMHAGVFFFVHLVVVVVVDVVSQMRVVAFQRGATPYGVERRQALGEGGVCVNRGAVAILQGGCSAVDVAGRGEVRSVSSWYVCVACAVSTMTCVESVCGESIVMSPAW